MHLAKSVHKITFKKRIYNQPFGQFPLYPHSNYVKYLNFNYDFTFLFLS